MQISREGGTSPLSGPEVRELFYRTGEAMMRVRIETEPNVRKKNSARVRTRFRSGSLRIGTAISRTCIL